MAKLPRSFFARDALIVARELLGKVIAMPDGSAAMIVETEGYKRDPASHAYKITPRSKIMQDTYAHWYVYHIYGMYYCVNITTNKDDVGAVLIRAAEPLRGIAMMQERRKKTSVKDLCSGPAKLCIALGITKELNNTKLHARASIFSYKDFSDGEVATSSRIGIKEGKDLQWRFYVKDSEFVS